MNTHSVKKQHSFFYWLSWAVTLVCAAFVWYGVKHPTRSLFGQTIFDANYVDQYTGKAPPQAVYPGWVGAGAFVLYWFLAYAFFYFRACNRVANVALKPIPDLAAIDAQLRAEGYNPSIADCVALQQHLTHERNEHAVVLGALVVGPQLLARQAQGKPLL